MLLVDDLDVLGTVVAADDSVVEMTTAVVLSDELAT